MKKSSLIKVMSFYPPFLGAGIRVKKVSSDFRFIEVEMKKRFWNKNYVGTQFGGSLYSMVDPFFMLMMIENLGKGYTVWDKSATIRFRSPGHGTVHAQFKLTEQDIEVVRQTVEKEGRAEPHYQVQITDDEGKLIAEVEKVLSVRKKG
jgi:acyl-coenzyme A thioesterase PaaI-like protein